MRLIDADAFKVNMEKKYGYRARQPQDDIDAQPTIDAVPVVRCKDCRYGVSKAGYIYCPNTDCGHDHDFYCADGERRDGEQDEAD